jgi:adenylate cyclase
MRDTALRRLAPAVGAGIAPGGGFGEPGEVMRPTFGVAGALGGVGEAAMGHAQQRAAIAFDQVDLGLCRPLGRTILISGAVAAETSVALVALGTHELRGIASPCAVYTPPDGRVGEFQRRPGPTKS